MNLQDLLKALPSEERSARLERIRELLRHPRAAVSTSPRLVPKGELLDTYITRSRRAAGEDRAQLEEFVAALEACRESAFRLVSITGIKPGAVVVLDRAGEFVTSFASLRRPPGGGEHVE